MCPTCPACVVYEAVERLALGQLLLGRIWENTSLKYSIGPKSTRKHPLEPAMSLSCYWKASLASCTPITKENILLSTPFYYSWCMYHTRSKLLLGAVVLGPHAKIDLLAPGFIFIFIIYWDMCGGDSLTC